MAGEWIPLRTDIFDCPQVVRILSELCPDSVRNQSERVRKTSEIVGALVRMWALFDRYTEDGILHNYTPNILDQVVGIEGFSETVQSVGWLKIHDKSLEMPEFSRYLSKTAKGRMKDSQRKQAERAASEKRPKSVQENPDEVRTTIQYNTIQKNIENTPPNPQGGKRSERFDASKEPLPKSIDTPEVREAWADWCRDKRSRGKKITEGACKRQFNKLVAWGPARAVIAIENAIAGGWSSFFEPKDEQCTKPPQQTFLEQLEQRRKELTQ